MKVAVYDTYVKKSNGDVLHFDIMVPEQKYNETKVRAFGETYIQEKGLEGIGLSTQECQFCHVENPAQEVVTGIENQGYYILEMEEIPYQLPLHPSRRDLILHLRAHSPEHRFADLSALDIKELKIAQAHLAQRRLHLQYEELNTPIQIKKLNLLFVFQVNCPGCFIYGIPMVNNLYQTYQSDSFGVLALSTAFEDFTLNTKENTQTLLEKGKIIGETKKYFGEDFYQEKVLFPVAMDKMLNAEQVHEEGILERISGNHPEYPTWPEISQLDFQNRIKNYLGSLEKVSYTFTMNHLRGTPSFILFDDQFNIIKRGFGHVDPQQLTQEIDKSLKNL